MAHTVCITINQKPYICIHTNWTGNSINFVKETCPQKKSCDGIPKEFCRKCNDFKITKYENCLYCISNKKLCKDCDEWNNYTSRKVVESWEDDI